MSTPLCYLDALNAAKWVAEYLVDIHRTNAPSGPSPQRTRYRTDA
ncbi:hypothetical protein [Mycobacterium sp.]